MCGISGLFHFDPAHSVDETVIDRMRSVIGHRGPDDSGLYVRGNVGLGFNRLSIIDLFGGRQPMSNEDGTVWIVFNGEIYNFLELRKDLICRGYRFRTRSDTEVIVHAWEEFGERCVEKLRGMFAFVIWDSRRRLLFGARDRLGIKPFYYYADDGTFAFASEIKSLLEIPDLPREVDQEALAEFLHHRYVIGPGTMLRGIQKLRPGHTITVGEAGFALCRYWEAPLDPPATISEADALEELQFLLEESVRLHLVSDVPLGAFLSGGLDSSSVVALMSRLGVADIKTFSVGYDSPESELDYARIVADHFHTDHYELRLTPSAFRDILPEIVWHMDEPVGDEASVPLYYLSRFARQNVTVALSGEGSDEIFGGYPIYRIMRVFDAVNRLPLASSAGRFIGRYLPDGKARKYGSMLGRPLEERYGGVSSVFTPEQVSRIFPGANGAKSFSGAITGAYRRSQNLDPLARMSYLDLKTWLADDLLVKADRMSMAHSLELRVPLLDHKLVEFAMRLPADLKVRGGVSKYLLKKCMEPLLPGRIIHRTKRGFPVPTEEWFRNELAGFARETLLAAGGTAEEFFIRQEIERLLEAHRRRDCGSQIFTLLVFDQWYRTMVKSPARPLEPAQPAHTR